MHIRTGRQSSLINAIWNRLFKVEIHGGRILDVGCGFNPMYNKSVSSEKYIKLDLEAYPNVDIQGDAMQLPFKDKSFDLAIMHEVSCCYTDGYKAAMIAELNRVAHVVYIRELKSCLWKKIGRYPKTDQLPGR